MNGYVTGPGGSVGEDPDVKASKVSTGGSITVIEAPTRGGAPLHVHAREDEEMYVLEGAIWARCGDERFDAGPRSFVFLPRGVPHEWDVVGDEALLLIITSPAGLEEFLHESTRRRSTGGRSSPDTGSSSADRPQRSGS